MKHDKLAIIGAGGHGRVVADIALAAGRYDSIVFFDDRLTCGEAPLPIAGRVDEAARRIGESDFVVAIGSQPIRQAIQERFEAMGAEFAVLVHPSAAIGGRVMLGAGTVVMAGAVINCDTSLGRGCIVNTGATIDHDNVLGNFVHISPGAHLGGAVSIGSRCWIGLGGGIINGCAITEDCMIGAGAVVCRSITESGTYIGVPAKRREK